MPDFTNFQEVITLLGSASGVMLWAIWVSDFYRNKAEDEGSGFNDWSTLAKQAVIYASFALPPIAAYLLIQFPTVAALIEPHYPFAASLAIGGLGMMGWFKLNQAIARKGESTPLVGKG
jgi:hypothetical protein